MSELLCIDDTKALPSFLVFESGQPCGRIGTVRILEQREGCDDCLRRTSPPPNPERVWMMAPPAIIVFECEYRIEPEEE